MFLGTHNHGGGMFRPVLPADYLSKLGDERGS